MTSPSQPTSPSVDAIAALEHIKTVCEDNAAPTVKHRMALDFVRQIASAALAAPRVEPVAANDVARRLRADECSHRAMCGEAAHEIERLRQSGPIKPVAPVAERELTDVEGKLIQQALIDSGTPLYVLPSQPDTGVPVEAQVESVAKAIYDHWANHPACSNSKPWDEMRETLPGQAEDFRRKARAAIRALAALPPDTGSRKEA